MEEQFQDGYAQGMELIAIGDQITTRYQHPISSINGIYMLSKCFAFCCVNVLRLNMLSVNECRKLLKWNVVYKIAREDDPHHLQHSHHLCFREGMIFFPVLLLVRMDEL